MSEVGMWPESDLERDLEQRWQALLLEVEAVFADVRKGDGIGIREAAQRDATHVDNPETRAALIAARAADVEDRWQDIPKQLLMQYEAPLMWTDNLGFRFMLPAYIRYALRSWYPQATAAHHQVEWLMAALGGLAIFRLETAEFTTAQLTCVKHFIIWIKDCELVSIEDNDLERLNNWLETH